MGLYSFLLGVSEFSFCAEDQAEILDCLLTHGIACLFCRIEGERGRLLLLSRDAGRLPQECRCTLCAQRGLPALLSAYVRRPGLVAGTVLAMLILLLSSFTVWRVEVLGNELVSSQEIEAALAEAGLAVGSFTPGADTAAVRTRFLKSMPSVAWVGIYVRGTTVSVEVREVLPNTEEESRQGLCNLVASEDALIESVRVDRGRAAVDVGMTVRRGELLVSGLYQSATGLVATAAAGEIRARVVHRQSVVQPLSVKEKIYGEEKIASFSLNFFGKEIKVCKIAGKSGEEYDIIKRKEQVILFGSIRLPIYLTYEYRLPYTWGERALTEEEAVRAAYRRMYALLAADLAEGELLRKRFFGEFGEDAYLLSGEIESIIDIAVPLPYEVGEQGG
ncbi:MAG: sporulation protein YqfD [Clostridia bacterium]|nr:sporulation protein YqfD [Clostridia bacterium]